MFTLISAMVTIATAILCWELMDMIACAKEHFSIGTARVVFCVVVSILAILASSTLFFYHMSRDDSRTEIFYKNLQAQCKSINGTFNQSYSQPACYVRGERVKGEEEEA